MKFDKSKVCVAGLHEVKEGTKGWFADSVDELDDKVKSLALLALQVGTLDEAGNHSQATSGRNVLGL